jgi:hypothetical protein
MRPLTRALTTLLFAAHAMLGCCAHHACGAEVARHDELVATHADHHCSTDHGDSHEPGENGEQPFGPCHHDACSFVKIQPVRVDHGGGQGLWVAAELPLISGGIDEISKSLFEAGLPAPSCPARLYVRFCALLI